MERIDRYDALAELASRHMTKGVRANTLVSQAEYGPAAESGGLLAQETPAGLLIARDRGDHHRLNFYLSDLTVPLGANLPAPAVTEVAFRPRDPGLQETVPYLQSQGFALLLWRIRMSRPAGLPEPPALPVRTAEPTENRAVQAFLRENFSPLTGCLPNEAELAETLAQGQVLVLEEAGAFTGLLHFSHDGKSGEIRHLAVRADHRGRGLTRPLIAAFLQATGGAKSTVWLREDFPAARAAYETMGFAPDGRRSAVLCYDPK